MISTEQIEALRTFCREVREVQQGGEGFLYLEGLRLPPGRQPAEVDAILCTHARDGYSTRLFLSAQISGCALNWSAVYLLDRQWYTWSWQGVSPNQQPVQILAGHLKAFQ